MKNIKKYVILLLISICMSAVSFGAVDYIGQDQNNKIISLANYRGKYVILNFWATWCPPCRAELPGLEKLYKKYGENKKEVVFIGLNEGEKEKVVEFLDDRHITFPTLIGMQNIYPIQAYPTMVILDKKGDMLGHFVGAVPEDVLDDYIQNKLLKGKK